MQKTTTVELAYVPTTADTTGAVRARRRATSAGRRQSGIILACAIIVLGDLVLASTAAKGPHLGSTVICLAALALFIGLYAFGPVLRGRRIHRMVAGQGEFRAVVSDAGVRLTSRDSEATYRWPMITRYVETATLFVLLTPDKHGVGMLVLPKRGAAEPADADRLRAVLDRNADRI
ncbi:YcxB family protein [Streptomyces sp. SAS_269]|uniref:YcxB family protein n=1 Tax=Streptomyces sp. SAS_269 TaxID=3412749 RepID=UPI00403C53CD